MGATTGTITLTPVDEAARLWAGATAAFERAKGDLLSLLSALDFGVRAVEIHAVERLRKAAPRFPATIQALLETPDPTVEALRDAISVPATLHFVDLLDMLSEDPLDCVGPALHRGWEDKRPACLRARKVAREATATRVTAADRPHLLLLAAYRNRLFRLPPPVRIATDDLVAAFPALVRLFESMRGP